MKATSQTLPPLLDGRPPDTYQSSQWQKLTRETKLGFWCIVAWIGATICLAAYSSAVGSGAFSTNTLPGNHMSSEGLDANSVAQMSNAVAGAPAILLLVAALRGLTRKTTATILLRRQCTFRTFALDVYVPAIWGTVWRSAIAILLSAILSAYASDLPAQQVGSFITAISFWIFALLFTLDRPLWYKARIRRLVADTPPRSPSRQIETEIHLSHDGKTLGAFTRDQVLAMLQSSMIQSGTLGWTAGHKQWRPVCEIVPPQSPPVPTPPPPSTANAPRVTTLPPQPVYAKRRIHPLVLAVVASAAAFCVLVIAGVASKPRQSHLVDDQVAFNRKLEGMTKRGAPVKEMKALQDERYSQVTNTMDNTKETQVQLLYGAMKPVNEEATRIREQGQTALVALTEAGGVDFKGMTHADLLNRLALAKKFQASAAEAARFFPTMPDQLDRKLQAINIRKADRDQILAKQYQKHAIIVQLMQANQAYSNAIIDLLQYLENTNGQWSNDDGTILFQTQELLDGFNAIARRHDTTMITAQSLQAQFVSP